MKPIDDSWRALTERYLRGDLNADEVTAFELRLQENEAARTEFRRATRLDANLRTLATERQGDVAAWSASRASGGEAAGLSWFRWLGRWLAPVAAGLVVAAIFWWKHTTAEPQQATAPAEQSAAGFAVVLAQADARWGGGRRLAAGDLLARESLRLEAGIAQIELFSGVSVIVEGDAEFEILSPMEMAVTRGRVRARVPEPAHGFRIRTTEGDVVDLGTEFALQVSASNSEVHVLDGEVEWHPRAETMRRMEAGQALRWGVDGKGTLVTANAAGFVGLADMGTKLTAARQARREEWERFSGNLRRDPRLLAYYQMGVADSWNRRLPNEAAAGADTVHEGAIVAAARAPDRWGAPGGALDFSPAGSRVRVDVPGEYRSLTLLCWVKINSLDRWYNSLFLTDGHDLGEPHWQILNDGRLFFSVKSDTPGGKQGKRQPYYSPPFWSNALSGQWLMLAVTYDRAVGRVTHYLNGRAISTEAIPQEHLTNAPNVRIGAASIGNWNDPAYRQDAEFAVRNLNGSMDEFAIFAQALSADKIFTLHAHGKP